MGAIKIKSDEVIINNDKELITPAIVRQVNDVIDAQVEAAKESITTLTTNLQTLGSGVIPNGGTTGQLLAKKTNTDKDTEWVDAPIGGGGSSLPIGGTEGQILTKTSTSEVWATIEKMNWKGDFELETVYKKGDLVRRYQQPIEHYVNVEGVQQIEVYEHYDFYIKINDYVLQPEENHYLEGRTDFVKILDFSPFVGALQKNGVIYLSKLGGSFAGKIAYDADFSGDFDERSIPDVEFLQNHYLPTSGGTMGGDINMFGYSLTNLQFLEGNDGFAFKYPNEPIITSNNDVPHVGYVNSSVRIAKKELAGFPVSNTVITLDHNFNDNNVIVEIWANFQDGTVNVQSGYKKIIDDKYNIIRTSPNQIQIDVLGDFTGNQTLGEVEILIYSYKNAVVTIL